MKVTFLAPNYAPSVGGAQAHVRRVAEGLARRPGYVVEVLTGDTLIAPASRVAGRVERRQEHMGGVVVRRRPVARRLHTALRTIRRVLRRFGLPEPSLLTAAMFGPLGLRMALAARGSARGSDVVVGVPAPFLTLWAAERWTRRSRAAFVAMPLLHAWSEEVQPWVPRVIRRADGCTCSTVAERDWLVGHGVDPRRVEMLPPGCDPDSYPETTPSAARDLLGLPHAPTVGCIGRLAAHKGIDTLLAAAETVWKVAPDTTILVAGIPTGWEGLDAAVARARSVGAGRVVVREGFSDDERANYLAACDVVAFPSREESFGMVILEAWCARRPVVAADIPPVRSIVQDGQDAVLVPAGDPMALADALVSLLADPAARARLGAAGRARARREYAWDAIVDGWDDFLRGVAATADDVGRRRRSRA